MDEPEVKRPTETLEVSRPQFKLRRASVKGAGLQPEFRDAAWEKIRDACYEGRRACSVGEGSTYSEEF